MNGIEKRMLALQAEREQKAKEKVWFVNKPMDHKLNDFSTPVYQKKKKIVGPKIVENLSPSQIILVRHFEFISAMVEYESANITGHEHNFNIAVQDYQKNIRVLRNYDERQIWEIIKNKFRREFNFLKQHIELQNKLRE